MRAFFFFFVLLSISVAGAMALVGETIPADAHNSAQLQDLARFAIQQHVAATKNSGLKFVRLLSARKQIVAGVMYYLTLEVELANGKMQQYEAKIWEKAWMNFKKLESFTLVEDQSSIILANLGVKQSN